MTAIADDEGLDDAMDTDEASSPAMQAAGFEARAGIDDIMRAVKMLPADANATHLASVLEQLRAAGSRTN